MPRIMLPLFLLMICFSSFSQSKPGEVACVYITTPDLDSSSSIYEKLGFQQTASNTFPVPWTQLLHTREGQHFFLFSLGM